MYILLFQTCKYYPCALWSCWKSKKKKLSLHISSKCLWCKIGPTGYAHSEKYSVAVRWNPANGAPYCLAIFRTSQDEAEVKVGIENSRLNSFLLNHLIVEDTTTLDFDLNTALLDTPHFLISLSFFKVGLHYQRFWVKVVYSSPVLWETKKTKRPGDLSSGLGHFILSFPKDFFGTLSYGIFYCDWHFFLFPIPYDYFLFLIVLRNEANLPTVY